MNKRRRVRNTLSNTLLGICGQAFLEHSPALIQRVCEAFIIEFLVKVGFSFSEHEIEVDGRKLLGVLNEISEIRSRPTLQTVSDDRGPHLSWKSPTAPELSFGALHEIEEQPIAGTNSLSVF